MFDIGNYTDNTRLVLAEAGKYFALLVVSGVMVFWMGGLPNAAARISGWPHISANLN